MFLFPFFPIVSEDSMSKAKIDIMKQPSVVSALNAILNSKGIAEVKLEWDGKQNQITVVDIRRKLIESEPIND